MEYSHINPGVYVAIRLNNGRPSRSQYKRGRVYIGGYGRSLVDFPALPITGCSLDRRWIDNNKLAIVNKPKSKGR